jgi:hypothetical protein
LASYENNESVFALRTDLRQMTPAVVAGAVTIRALSHAKEEKGKRNADRRSNRRTCRCSARLRGALAYRRSTTVLT